MKSLPQQPRQQAPNLLLLDWPALSQGPTPRQGLWLEVEVGGGGVRVGKGRVEGPSGLDRVSCTSLQAAAEASFMYMKPQVGGR